MIEFKSLKPELSITLDGAVKVTFSAQKAKLQALSALPEKEFDITIKEHRNKRSLDSNAYCWLLINEIADKLSASKDEIYFKMLKEYGQSDIVSVASEVDVSGYFKYYVVLGAGEVKGKQFTHYTVYKGSSEYNTKEMSVFIDGIVQEALDLGIDTRTPDEIAEMKSLWGKGDL